MIQPFNWDEYSDQAGLLKDKVYKKKMRKKEFSSLVKTFLISLGMNGDIILSRVSVKVLTCQLGSVLRLRCWSHGKLVMLLLMAAELALL